MLITCFLLPTPGCHLTHSFFHTLRSPVIINNMTPRATLSTNRSTTLRGQRLTMSPRCHPSPEPPAALDVTVTYILITCIYPGVSLPFLLLSQSLPSAPPVISHNLTLRHTLDRQMHCIHGRTLDNVTKMPSFAQLLPLPPRPRPSPQNQEILDSTQTASLW